MIINGQDIPRAGAPEKCDGEYPAHVTQLSPAAAQEAGAIVDREQGDEVREGS